MAPIEDQVIGLAAPASLIDRASDQTEGRENARRQQRPA
jgi:hypothetical protein